MARKLSRASRTYQPGVYGPFGINDFKRSDEGVRLTFTREAWPAGHVATVAIEMTDDGENWVEWFRQDLAGGHATSGNPSNIAAIECEWPGESDGAGGRRKLRKSGIRIKLDVAQALTTAIKLSPI